ncbi:hypothetical protein BN1723_004999 [Verticillium longisporum]|uniref:PHD-type domain-containing protein n=2 Tax=Verticillium longisporum TaxID=100787 RepID=A0A0G4N3K6_VERLO|nr:hypothetical protein BN1723_004999 [Verticillium longisporum]
MEETDSGSEPAAPSTWKGTLVFGTPEPEFSSEEGAADILESVENPEAYEFETHANKDVSNEALTDLLPESTEYEEHELLDATSQEPLAPLAQEFQEDELQPDVSDQHSPETQESQADSPRTTAPERIRPVQFEIVLPELSPEERARYREVHSDRVDFIYEEVAEQPYDPYYRIEYTDGRQHLVSESDLAAQHGGKTALRRWHAGITPEDIFEMSRGTAHKRSWEDGTEDGGSYGSLDDMMDVDDDDEDHMRTLYKRRRTSARASTSRTAPFSSDEDEPTAPAPPSRQLRDRQPRQLKLTKMAFANGNSFGDDDELALANLLNKSDGEDDDFQLITSDVVPRTGRGRKSLKKLKSSRSNYAARSSRDSSIEFEDDRRRSRRSTRNTKIMTDITAMDDDFSSVEEGKTTTAPKVVSVKEVFKPLPPDSDFSEYHVSVCDVCNQGSISNRGQVIGCQGCSLSFHKGCINSRAQRDHMATKVGDDSFVLQCKWCIGIYRKKDANAPHHAMCQSCKEDGKACKPFSKKKTAREEEKLRQDNGGVDPITKVEPYLVNNSEVVLFRCTTCKRGWHFEHLPSSRTESDVAGTLTYHGGRHSQDLAYKYELFPDGAKDMKAHIVVMSYDSAQDDRTKSLFRSVSWAGLVVDEGQRLKNDQNLLYLALKSMSFPFRLLLTGTPLQNNKRELFNLLQFVDTAHNAAKLDEEYAELNATNLPKLHEKIRPYFLRRTKAQVLKFLPPMAQIILPVSMTILQEKLCKSIMAKSPELIKAIFADDKIKKTKDRGSLNNILMQLRKCLCHPFIYSQAIEERSDDPIVTQRNLISASAKLLLLEIMLPKLKERGHRVLLFSQFLNQLDIVEDYLTGRGYDFRRLDGSISSLEKQRRIDAFNAPDSPVFAFLLSTRAGGVGINLATADTVIILDPDFNPHQDLQALSRAHRIGQKNKVLCFQLMTKNSVEEKIMQIGRKKMALDHVLIESMDNENDAGDDLESILKFGASALFSDEQDQKDIIRYDDASVDKLLDRTHIEQAKPDESGSGESQFSFAKVWANDKGTFEDDMAEHEDPTLNPSIWEDILAEREAVAQKLAEAEKVVLGRGGRRRTAINYRTNEANDVAGRTELDGSDVDGDFSADTDEDEESAGENEAFADVGITDLAGVVPRRAAVVKDTAPAPPVVAVGSKKRGRPRKTDTPQGERARGLKAKNPDSKQPAVQNTILSNRPQVVTHQNNPRVHNGIGPLWDSTALFVPGQKMLPSNAPSQAGPGYQNTRQDYQQSQHQSPFFNLPPNQSQQLPQQNLHPQTQGRLNGTGQASPDPWQGQPRQAIVETTLPSPQVSEATKPALPDMAYKAKIPGLTLESALKISKQMVTRIPPHRGHHKAQPAKTTLADMKCTGCLGDHLTSACNGRLTETQIRMALDELARMPDNSVVALEKLELKQRLLSIPV